ncbi:MAG: TonB-dependent receptor plug domain-containing protein [Bacteroidales bacterium]|nr:TonB-dependent receptor plug domain-containing protein [Bacteroidales bacterium]MDT8372386.1 TonB-dependent receptor plug domain-containing protein [Bacteroidales bacterium]
MKAKAIILVLMILLAGSQAEGQKREKLITVAGTVTDIEMSPVAGALIVIDLQDSGTKTRKNGTYKIKVRPDVRSVGVYTSNMGSVVTVFEGQQKIDFVLDGAEAMVNFAPVIREGDTKVDIGYGTAKKKDVNTDVGYIDGQTVDNASYSNIYDMIQGKVPGVDVVGNKITIRGVGSLMLSSDPLFVVDGVAVSSIDNINPREVKSISVLKGASAAIYGTRGANGVILITLIGTNR